MARHFKTSGNVYSLCEETGTDDVFQHGSDTGPADYCTACLEAEPEWQEVEDDEMMRLLQQIF